MQNAQINLHCPSCGHANLEVDRFCQQCQTPLPKRYLWAVGMSPSPNVELLGNRFVFKTGQIWLDTHPGLTSPYVVDLPAQAQPYLRLFSYRLHIPQLFTIVSPPPPSSEILPVSEILLLERPPLAQVDWGDQDQDSVITAPYVPALPLLQAWGEAGLIRQLNWLWQMVQLWQPLQLEGVASSLLQPELLRVEGPILRLLQLAWDESEPPGLSHLGQLWLRWLPDAHFFLRPHLAELGDKLLTRAIQTPEEVLQILDHWLAIATSGREPELPVYNYQISLATLSDQGMSRKRNEDACYPPSGSVMAPAPEGLAIVCDGVGGHAGGDVAANLAISVLESHRESIAAPGLNSEDVVSVLENAIFEANDRISERNDTENRQERQRMGTTLVLAWGQRHQVYIAHVGDSRAYWITRHGCYQVTLDDDVASREVRLGYALYQDALDHPLSGSLIQALGMGDSRHLSPTVQRFILDEDCVFLLCSDGLSDYDRVEECWQTEILPLLSGGTDLPQACERLIELANLKNGHDNVTVGLMHCQIRLGGTPEGSFPLAPTLTERATVQITPEPPPPKPDRFGWKHFPLLGLLLLLLGWLLYGQPQQYWDLLIALLPQQLRPQTQPDPPPTVSPPLSPVIPSTTVEPTSSLPLGPPSPSVALVSPGVDTVFQVSKVITFWPKPTAQPGQGQLLKVGSIVQMQPTPAPPTGWLPLKVCLAASGNSTQMTTSASKLPAGQIGWIQAEQQVHLRSLPSTTASSCQEDN